MLKTLKGQMFTGGIFAAILLAFAFPDFGASGGVLKSEISTKVAIGVIFFLQGLTLNTRKLLISITNLRLHIFCQSCVFLIAPALMFLLILLFGSWIPSDIRPGLLFLSVLPTTIVACTVFTAKSGGDAGAALFNATLSNLIGVVATPVWCLALFSSANSQFPPISSLVIKIAFYILLPIVLGQISRNLATFSVDSWGKGIKRINNSMILFVIYAAFCNSVANDVWAGFPISDALLAMLHTAAFLAILSSLVWTASRLASEARNQRIAAFFCGSQKTLAAGVPIAVVVFAGQSGNLDQSLILIPLMIYHTFQLVLGGILSGIFEQGSARTS